MYFICNAAGAAVGENTQRKSPKWLKNNAVTKHNTNTKTTQQIPLLCGIHGVWATFNPHTALPSIFYALTYATTPQLYVCICGYVCMYTCVYNNCAGIFAI